MGKSTSYCKPEIWGGMECTINRVGGRFQDQLSFSGHYERENDLELFAAMGIKALRFPILWERHEPVPDQAIDWTWASHQLSRLKALKSSSRN